MKSLIKIFFVFQLTAFIFPLILKAQCNDLDLSDNCRPVRLLFVYYPDADYGDSYEQIRTNIIAAVNRTNTAIANSKWWNQLPNNSDPDPQRFEIARIDIYPVASTDGSFLGAVRQQYLENQDYLYSIDITNEFYLISSFTSTTPSHCPAIYQGCTPGTDGAWTWLNYVQMNAQNSLAHEMGHQMGCTSNPGGETSCQRQEAPYNHGYIFTYMGYNYGDVMAYIKPASDRLLYYSNPYVYYPNDSDPNKVAIGTISTNFCSKCIFESKNQLRNICTTKVDCNLEPDVLPTGYSGEVIDSWELADALAQQHLTSRNGYLIKENAIVQFRAGKQIHIRDENNNSNFHAMSGCRFKAFISDGASGGFYGRQPNIGYESEAMQSPEISENAIKKVYPNPSSEMVHIDYSVFDESDRTIFITDMLGNKLIQLDKQTKHKKGNYSLDFDLKDIKTGQYLLVMDTGFNYNVKKFTVIK